MKKVLIIIIALAALAGIGASVYFGVSREEDGELLIFGMTLEALQVYVKEKIIPLASGVMTAVAAIYVAISPAINKMKAASGQFEQATRDVNSATGDVKENRRYVERIEKELKDDVAEMRREYETIDERLDEIEHAVLIAFTNQKELVANGSANRIAQVIKEHKKVEGEDEAESVEQAEA